MMSAPHKTVATAIVGGSTILATGAGLAAQVIGDDRIGVAFLGDRTLNEGAVYEAFNLASLWKLPVLYVCENNVGAPFDPKSSNLTVSQLVDVAHTFGIDAEAADAVDPVAFYDVAERAVSHVRHERRPMFLETRTNRWPGNQGGGDPSLAATGPTDIVVAWSPPADDQHEAWHRSDPVLRLTRAIIEEEVADQAGASEAGRRGEGHHRPSAGSRARGAGAGRRDARSSMRSREVTCGPDELRRGAQSRHRRRDGGVPTNDPAWRHVGVRGRRRAGSPSAFGRERVRSTPVSEEGYAGAAVGAAMAGLRPIVSFSTGSFTYNAWEPVVNEAALMRYMSGGQMSRSYRLSFLRRAPSRRRGPALPVTPGDAVQCAQAS